MLGSIQMFANVNVHDLLRQFASLVSLRDNPLGLSAGIIYLKILNLNFIVTNEQESIHAFTQSH